MSENLFPQMVHAITRNKLKLVQQTLNQGYNPDFADFDGETALHLAIDWGHTQIVRLLVSMGASTEVTDNLDNTPLHRAVMNENDEIVSLLLKAKAQVTCRNCSRQTPLDIAKQTGNVKIQDKLKNYRQQNISITYIFDNLEIKPDHYLSPNQNPNNNISEERYHCCVIA